MKHWDNQGWNDQTMVDLLNRFVEKQGLGDKLEEFLQSVADEANAECDPPPPPRIAPPPPGPSGPPGSVSNAIITARNGGVVPLFVDDIGGCSANYR